MEIVKGQTERHEFTITNDEGAFDLTGSTVRLIISDRYKAVFYEESKSSFSAPTTGVVTFTIPSTTTAAFPLGKAKMQIDVLNTSNEIDYSKIFPAQVIEPIDYDTP